MQSSAGDIARAPGQTQSSIPTAGPPDALQHLAPAQLELDGLHGIVEHLDARRDRRELAVPDREVVGPLRQVDQLEGPVGTQGSFASPRRERLGDRVCRGRRRAQGIDRHDSGRRADRPGRHVASDGSQRQVDVEHQHRLVAGDEAVVDPRSCIRVQEGVASDGELHLEGAVVAGEVPILRLGREASAQGLEGQLVVGDRESGSRHTASNHHAFVERRFPELARARVDRSLERYDFRRLSRGRDGRREDLGFTARQRLRRSPFRGGSCEGARAGTSAPERVSGQPQARERGERHPRERDTQ
jgi:hypothetical protein